MLYTKLSYLDFTLPLFRYIYFFLLVDCILLHIFYLLSIFALDLSLPFDYISFDQLYNILVYLILGYVFEFSLLHINYCALCIMPSVNFNVLYSIASLGL